MSDAGIQLDYRISALAEYSWNSMGRTAAGFAKAWATRRGHRDSDAFAEWAAIAGELGAQQYRLHRCIIGSPPGHLWPAMLVALAQGKAPAGNASPVPRKQIEKSLDLCEKLEMLAERIGSSDISAETRVLLRFCELEDAGHNLIDCLQLTDAAAKAAGQPQALRAFRAAAGRFLKAVEAKKVALNPSRYLAAGLTSAGTGFQKVLADVEEALTKRK